jgi:hypothetical protein
MKTLKKLIVPSLLLAFLAALTVSVAWQLCVDIQRPGWAEVNLLVIFMFVSIHVFGIAMSSYGLYRLGKIVRQIWLAR